MIDFSNEIFNTVAEDLRLLFPGIQILGEYVRFPANYPTVTIDEIINVPAHLDNCENWGYSRITYRIQVFSNKAPGKRQEAREIYKAVEKALSDLGFVPRTFSTMPEVYNADIYAISSSFEAVIDKNGCIYRA